MVERSGGSLLPGLAITNKQTVGTSEVETNKLQNCRNGRSIMLDLQHF